MFAGKTTKLIGLYNESMLSNDEKLVVKPLLDQRYNASKINSHGGLQMLAHRISKAEEIYPLITETTKEVYIDEVQEELDAAIGKRLAREQRKWDRERAAQAHSPHCLILGPCLVH